MRTAIVINDGLGLEQGLRLNAIDPLGVRQLANLTDQQRAAAFAEWLKASIDEGILELQQTAGAESAALWQQRFVQAAYLKGVQSAMASLARYGLDIAEQTVAQILGSTFHSTRLEVLFFRNFTELKGITGTMAQGVMRELIDGLASGKGPRQIATAINKKVEGIGIKRARILARTEIIRANNEAQLAAFEQFGVSDVTVEAEFLTAGDSRVCAQCAALEGQIFPLDKAHGMIPVHPQCRCTWIPVTERNKPELAGSAA